MPVSRSRTARRRPRSPLIVARKGQRFVRSCAINPRHNFEFFPRESAPVFYDVSPKRLTNSRLIRFPLYISATIVSPPPPPSLASWRVAVSGKTRTSLRKRRCASFSRCFIAPPRFRHSFATNFFFLSAVARVLRILLFNPLIRCIRNR